MFVGIWQRSTALYKQRLPLYVFTRPSCTLEDFSFLTHLQHFKLLFPIDQSLVRRYHLINKKFIHLKQSIESLSINYI